MKLAFKTHIARHEVEMSRPGRLVSESLSFRPAWLDISLIYKNWSVFFPFFKVDEIKNMGHQLPIRKTYLAIRAKIFQQENQVKCEKPRQCEDFCQKYSLQTCYLRGYFRHKMGNSSLLYFGNMMLPTVHYYISEMIISFGKHQVLPIEKTNQHWDTSFMKMCMWCLLYRCVVVY